MAHGKPVTFAGGFSGVHTVFVEGGPTLASAFVAAGLVDEYLIYLAPMLIGGERMALGDIGISTLQDARQLRIASVERLGDDVLIVARPAIPMTDAIDEEEEEGR